MNIYQYKTTIKHSEKARLPDSHPPGRVFPDPHSGAGEVGVGSSTPRQASGLRSQAPHKAGRVPRRGRNDRNAHCAPLGHERPCGGQAGIAARRRCNDSPTSSEARAMVWGGLDSVRPRPRRGRAIREIRARGDGINGPLRGPKLTIPHTPHLRSCLARCGAIIASPLRGLDGKTPMRPAHDGAETPIRPVGRERPRGGRTGIARGEHALGVRNTGKRPPPTARRRFAANVAPSTAHAPRGGGAPL